MSVDYTSIANNSAILAAILTPLLGYLNKDSQTYFLDLLSVPFVLFMITILTSTISPDNYSIFLFSLGVAVDILIYVMMTVEQYYFGKSKLTP